MYSGSAWSHRYNEPQTKLNYRNIEWVSLMKECLMGTEISQKCENERETRLDPKLVMDVRHKMVKESPKILGFAQIQSHTEGLRLVRLNNRNRMLKQKEERIIEKEIAKLKQSFDNNRLSVQKMLDETEKRRVKSSPNVPKFVGCYAKVWKRLEFHDGAFEVDTWQSHSVQMSMETKMNQQGVPFNVKVSVKRQGQTKESLKPVTLSDRNTLTDEVECVQKFLGADDCKNEIIRRYFEGNKEPENQELESDSKKIKEISKETIGEIKNKTNRRLLKQVWETWKDYARQLKNRKKEKTIYKVKVEAFLSNLQEKSKEAKKQTNGKNEIGKTREKQTPEVNEEKDERLKKMMEEVRTSRAEACQKLQEMSKVNLQNEQNYANVKFLKRMEERREERLKRWRDIQEKKLKLEEERRNAEKLMKDEKKQKEEENKRKKLEEWKEKRRIEEEKKKEKERERERLRESTNLAENHYRKYLVRSYGLRPWLALIKIRDSQLEKASEFFERTLTRKAFHRLTSNVREEIRSKVARSLEFQDRMLKKNVWLIWLEFYKDELKQNQVAADWNDFKITERAFKKWTQFTQHKQLEYLNKENVALLSYERKLKVKYLKKLRDYPDFKKLEQAKENRKRKWRQRVKEILPDYQPVEISKSFNSCSYE